MNIQDARLLNILQGTAHAEPSHVGLRRWCPLCVKLKEYTDEITRITSHWQPNEINKPKEKKDETVVGGRADDIPSRDSGMAVGIHGGAEVRVQEGS